MKAKRKRTQQTTSSALFRELLSHIQSAGKEVVTGTNVLVAIFAERETHAAFFLQEQGVTRYDVVNFVTTGLTKRDLAQRDLDLTEITSSIGEASVSAPQFTEKAGRLSYTEKPALGNFKERKAAVIQRLTYLRTMCATRANEQPQLNTLVNRYKDALGRLNAKSGSYNLFLIGLELESLVRLKTQAITDQDRNPPLDADHIVAVHSLMTAHAGLIVLFPDISNVTIEFDRYRDLSTSAA